MFPPIPLSLIIWPDHPAPPAGRRRPAKGTFASNYTLHPRSALSRDDELLYEHYSPLGLDQDHAPGNISAMAAKQFEAEDQYAPIEHRLDQQERHPGLKPHAAAINAIRVDAIVGTPSVAKTIHDNLTQQSAQASQQARCFFDAKHAREMLQIDAKGYATRAWNDHIFKCGLQTRPELLRKKAVNLAEVTVQYELLQLWKESIMLEIVAYGKRGVSLSHKPRYQALRNLVQSLLPSEEKLETFVESEWKKRQDQPTVVSQDSFSAPEDPATAAKSALPTPLLEQASTSSPAAPAPRAPQAKVPEKLWPSLEYPNRGFGETTTIMVDPKIEAKYFSNKRPADAPMPQSKKAKTQNEAPIMNPTAGPGPNSS